MRLSFPPHPYRHSQAWLTTPRSGSTPLLALDSSCGSNLAQSCYYVADRDSEEDEEEVRQEVEDEEKVGWQGQGLRSVVDDETAARGVISGGAEGTGDRVLAAPRCVGVVVFGRAGGE